MKSRITSNSRDLDAFFETVLNFRKRIWALSENRYLQQTLERIVIPLYALYVIRRSQNLEAILQTTKDCTDNQDRILVAYEQKHFEEARETARSFLMRMKEDPGARLQTS
jgi:DNA-binding GntR family transcriptional regulator